MKMLAIADAAYIAAFVDGEGCITININRTRQKKQCWEPCYQLCCKVTNTHLPILTWLRDVTGLGSVNPMTETKSHWKRTWVWELRRDEIQEFLPAVMPFLKIKLPQAELMLEYLTLETGFYHTVIPRDISISRKLIQEEIAELNKKGR